MTGSISWQAGSITHTQTPSTPTRLFGSVTAPLFEEINLFRGNSAGYLGYSEITSTLFTTPTGSINASSVGDPIGRQLNISPAPAFNLTQSTAAAKPTLGRIPVGGRRNQFLNTATLSTQNVTTRAVEYTMSFKGTGSITLTGTSTAGPLTGTGANDRVSLTFTPTAGTLTCTVAGSVTEAQIQFGAAFDRYQAVGAAYDVTEDGKRSILMPYNATGDYMTTGVQSFGTASFFAAADQQWWVAGAISKTTLAGSTLFSKRETLTDADVTLHVFTSATNGKLNVRVRGTGNEVGPDLVDGLLHTWIVQWDGSSLVLYIDSLSPISLSVGTAVEEAVDILVSARTPSSPGAFFVGFNQIVGFGDRALSATEIVLLRGNLNALYRGV